MKKRESSHVLVLLSGGIDSSACVPYYLSQGVIVSGLFVEYGPAAAELERKARPVQKKYSCSELCLHYTI